MGPSDEAYEPTFDDSMYPLSVETKQYLTSILHQIKRDGSVWKFGSCYLRQTFTQTYNQSHYNKDYFDNDNAKILISGITSDKEGGAIEGFAIAYGKHIGISVNVRNERPGSFGRNPKRGDVGFTVEDHGCLYAIPTRFASKQDFDLHHVSYHHKKQNYLPEELDSNGRKLHPTYDTGRKQHPESIRQRQLALGALHQHNFQDPEFIKNNRQRLLDMKEIASDEDGCSQEEAANL